MPRFAIRLSDQVDLLDPEIRLRSIQTPKIAAPFELPCQIYFTAVHFFSRMLGRIGGKAPMRFYYYVIPLPNGRWELRSSLESKPRLHPSKEHAVLAARIRCRRQWEKTGIACGVRIRIADGQWHDEILFGEAEEETLVSQEASDCVEAPQPATPG
jgi:hypothetical protein